MFMNKLKKILSLIIVMVLCFSFAACKNDKLKINDPISIDNCNTSSVNVASGFIQAIFTDDEELFYQAFPEDAFSSYIEEGVDPFIEYKNGVDSGFIFNGIAFSGENEFTEENGYDENYMRTNISIFHSVSEDSISSISLVKLRVYFDNPERGDSAASDAYVLTYRVDNNWYVFEMANSDADFKA